MRHFLAGGYSPPSHDIIFNSTSVEIKIRVNPNIGTPNIRVIRRCTTLRCTTRIDPS